jgi:hypothetical protein
LCAASLAAVPLAGGLSLSGVRARQITYRIFRTFGTDGFFEKMEGAM